MLQDNSSVARFAPSFVLQFVAFRCCARCSTIHLKVLPWCCLLAPPPGTGAKHGRENVQRAPSWARIMPSAPLLANRGGSRPGPVYCRACRERGHGRSFFASDSRDGKDDVSRYAEILRYVGKALGNVGVELTTVCRRRRTKSSAQIRTCHDLRVGILRQNTILRVSYSGMYVGRDIRG